MPLHSSTFIQLALDLPDPLQVDHARFEEIFEDNLTDAPDADRPRLLVADAQQQAAEPALASVFCGWARSTARELKKAKREAA